MDNKSKTNLSWRLVGISIVSLALLVTVSLSWFLYEHTVNLLTDNLRQRLLSIVTTAVVQIEAEDINTLKVENDWRKPEWRRVVTQLKKVKDNNQDIVFAYIFRKKIDSGTDLEFVADAESINPYANTDEVSENDVDANKDGVIDPDGPDALQWPGQDYPEPPAEALEAYQGPLTNKELYEDQWGKVLTGYAPIKDEENRVVGILAIDIKANDFLTITSQTLYPFLGFISVLILIIIILAVSLISIWNKRVELFAELDRQKDELLSIVSHQLATPVSSMKWYLEMLLDGDLGKITAQQKEHVESMQKIGTNLGDLVSMILDVSRIQLGRMHIEKQELDLNEFCKEIWEVIEPKAEEKHITFEKNVPSKLPKANLDRRYTHMIFENLLSNAVKYTPSKGKVRVDVQIRDNMLYCTVQDTGCGIPKSEQNKIFEKLFRASNVRNTVDGNGFGLYVVKGAVEAQGGKIWFESEENRGTTFHVELPLNEK